ncbi:MAG: hypothetical protein ACK5L5_08060, partial [Bacteroidales bacterium]
MNKLYIFLVLWISVICTSIDSAQSQELSPGGVQGVKAWFNTEALQAGHNYSHWVDKSGHNLMLNQGENLEFQWDDKEHNFHKSLLFYRDDVFFDLPFSAGRQLTTFGLFNPYQYNIEQPYEFLLYDVISTGSGESFNVTTDKLYTPGGAVRLDYGDTVGSDLWYRSAEYSADQSSRYNTTKILSHYKAVAPNYGIWGEDETTRVYINRARTGATKIWYFIPEFIVYDRLLRPTERLRIESYMARKYAIPLECSYLSPNNELMWDIVANKTYNKRIVYLGREDISDLYQKDAVSSYENYNYNNIEGIEGQAETGYNSTSDNRSWNNRDMNRLVSFHINMVDSSVFPSNGSYGGFSDGEYLMIGDDNGSLKVNTSDSKGIAGMHTIGRTWQVLNSVSNQGFKRTEWQVGDSLVLDDTEDIYPTLTLKNSAGEEINSLASTTTSLVGDYGSIELALSKITNEAKGSIFIGFSNTNTSDAEVYYGFEIDP